MEASEPTAEETRPASRVSVSPAIRSGCQEDEEGRLWRPFFVRARDKFRLEYISWRWTVWERDDAHPMANPMATRYILLLDADRLKEAQELYERLRDEERAVQKALAAERLRRAREEREARGGGAAAVGKRADPPRQAAGGRAEPASAPAIRGMHLKFEDERIAPKLAVRETGGWWFVLRRDPSAGPARAGYVTYGVASVAFRTQKEAINRMREMNGLAPLRPWEWGPME